MAARADSPLWNQRAGCVHNSPDPTVTAGDESSTKVKVPPRTAAYSLPPGPPSGFAKREQPPDSTHSTMNSMRRVPAGAVNIRSADDLNDSGQSFAATFGWHDRKGEPSTDPSASVAAIV